MLKGSSLTLWEGPRAWSQPWVLCMPLGFICTLTVNIPVSRVLPAYRAGQVSLSSVPGEMENLLLGHSGGAEQGTSLGSTDSKAFAEVGLLLEGRA